MLIQPAMLALLLSFAFGFFEMREAGAIASASNDAAENCDDEFRDGDQAITRFAAMAAVIASGFLFLRRHSIRGRRLVRRPRKFSFVGFADAHVVIYERESHGSLESSVGFGVNAERGNFRGFRLREIALKLD